MKKMVNVIVLAGVVLVISSAASAGTIYWTPAHELAPQGYSCRMAAGDLDGDGDYDISVVGLHPVEQFWNIGTAEEPVWQLDSSQFTEISYCSNRGGGFADLDADGDLDLVMGCYYEDFLRFYWNVGTPQVPLWAADITVLDGIVVGINEKLPRFADMDADGDKDLMVCDGGGRIRFTRNTGSTTIPEFEGHEFVDGIPFAYAAMPSTAVGDLDQDGDLDIVRVTVDSWPECFENVGTPQVFEFAENPDMLIGIDLRIEGAWGIELFDVDADGDPDMILAVGMGENLLFLNGGATPVERTSWGVIKAMYR